MNNIFYIFLSPVNWYIGSSDNIYIEITFMDWELYLVVSIIAITVIIVLILVPAVHFSKKTPKQLNDIYTGMSETDMLEILGKPKKIEQIDETTKMYLYSQVDKGGYFLWSYYKDFKFL